MTQRYISAKQLAQYLGLSFGTVRNKLCSHPEQLPPFSEIPIGPRSMKLFDIQEVDKWMAERRNR